MQARTGLSRADKRSLYRAFWKQAQRSNNEWPRAFCLRLQVEAVWAEAISRGLLCMEGAPGLCCLPHLKIHQQHFTILALCPPPPPPAHSKKSLLSAVKKLCLSYHSQTGLTRRKPRPGRANAGLCCGVYNSNTGPLCQGRMLSSALFEFLGAEFGRTQSRAAPMGFLRDRCPLYHLLAPDF